MAGESYLKNTLTTFAVLFLLVQVTFGALPRYEITDLGTIGGDQSGAMFINDLGQIVGSAYNQQWNRRATLFDSTGNGNNIDLGTLGGINSWVKSMNCSGQIVGFAENQQGYGRATLFDPTDSGKNIDLGTLGELRSNALSINDSGQIVGSARNGQEYQRATLFDPTGGGNNIDLGTLGSIHSQAWSINDRGQIVGNARIPRGYSHATLFDPTGGGNNIDLGTLGGNSSNAHSINNLGQIVGWAANPWLDNRATLFDPTGGANNIELGTLGGSLSWALSINDLGQIVGAADNQQRDSRATLFDPTGNGNNIDLNTIIKPASGWILTNAFCINNHGWIVGNQFNQEGQGRAFLMKPLPRTIYVGDDAAGANDGSSWADAFNYLQDALAAANDGDEIRVAQGIYKPDEGAGITPGDRTATFQLINGVTIKGGYAGFGHPNHNARDIEAYETVLNGDLAGNDVDVNNPADLLDEPTRTENSLTVVTGSGTDATAILDSFVIRGGHYDILVWGSPNIGAGMHNCQGSPTVINCTFNSNSAGNDGLGGGGGMYNSWSSPTLTNCRFKGNSAGRWGGGMYNYGSSPMLTHCIFSGNSAQYYGGGMANASGDGECSPTITNCTITNNSAVDGGGIYNHFYSSPTVINCTISNNTVSNWGGGILNYFWSSARIINCTFIGNSAGWGGGMLNKSCYSTVTNCVFIGNSVRHHGGAMYNGSGSPNITNCTFVSNWARGRGGAILNYCRSNPTLTNCIFWHNGDEIYNFDCPIASPNPTFSYCDIEKCGGSGNDWDNYLGTDCAGNIDADPFFVSTGYWDANGVWVDGDYHLLPDSPCIDTGDPNYIAGPNETDLDGKPRVLDGDNDGVPVVDMGAYEYGQLVSAEARILPRTINLSSNGKWITAYIWLPGDYNVTDFDPNNVFLEDEIQPVQFSVDEQQQVATAKFNREDVQPILEVGDINLKITGRLTDGTVFEGADTIKVIEKAGKN